MQPLRGCQSCRAAKVKCDQHRPTCHRCERLRLSCVFDEVNVFRDQNEVAERHASRGQTRRKSKSPNQPPISESSQGTELLALDYSHTLFYPWLKEVPRGISLSIDDQATSIFISNYVLDPCNHGLSPGYLEMLPHLLTQSNSNSTLKLCTSTASMAYLAACLQQNDLQLRARQLYGRALMALSKTINQHITKDSTLMAVLVLDFVDLFFGDGHGPLGSHSKVLPTVMRMRGTEQLATSIGWSLFRVACERLQIMQIMSPEDDVHSSSELDLWIDMLNPSGLSAQLTKNNREVVRLCHLVRKTLNTTDSDVSQHLASCADLRSQMEILDTAITLEHYEVEPALESKQIFRPPDAPRPEGAVIETTTLLIYHDLWLAKEWTIHNGFRLILLDNIARVLNAMLGCQSALGPSPNIAEWTEQFNSTVESIKRTANSIISSAPMLAGTVDHDGNFYSNSVGKSIGAFFLLFPLEAVFRASHTTIEMKHQSSNLLTWMHRRMATSTLANVRPF